LTLLYKVLRSENSEKNSEQSRLFTRTNLVLRPASARGVSNIKIERHPVRFNLGVFINCYPHAGRTTKFAPVKSL